jgi:hypothetical protein
MRSYAPLPLPQRKFPAVGRTPLSLVRRSAAFEPVPLSYRQRNSSAIRRAPTFRAVARPVFRARPLVVTRTAPVQTIAIPETGLDIEAGPYLDYARRLTPEGGILIVYKDLDVRWRQIIWRVLAGMAFTGFESWLIADASPVESLWINAACLLAAAGINFLILWKLPETYRSIEIRPDCMIIEGSDVFWLSHMESLPTLQKKENGKEVVCGIYGTRYVEYLTVRRFDDNDRTPEVFAAHLKDAIQQLWIPDQGSERRQGHSPRWEE